MNLMTSSSVLACTTLNTLCCQLFFHLSYLSVTLWFLKNRDHVLIHLPTSRDQVLPKTCGAQYIFVEWVELMVLLRTPSAVILPMISLSLGMCEKDHSWENVVQWIFFPIKSPLLCRLKIKQSSLLTNIQ